MWNSLSRLQACCICRLQCGWSMHQEKHWLEWPSTYYRPQSRLLRKTLRLGRIISEANIPWSKSKVWRSGYHWRSTIKCIPFLLPVIPPVLIFSGGQAVPSGSTDSIKVTLVFNGQQANHHYELAHKQTVFLNHNGTFYSWGSCSNDRTMWLLSLLELDVVDL